MKQILWLAGWLMVMPVYASSSLPVQTALVADEGIKGHLDYLTIRLQQEQFAAIDTLLDSLAMGQREYLLYQLLTGLTSTPGATPTLQAWVRAQSLKAPQWLVEGEVDGFLVQQPAYDFASQARLLLSHWQQQAWQDQYRQQLEQDRFEFKSIYYRQNPDILQQQEALLAALAPLSILIWNREAQRLASQNIFLPDNQLLTQLLLRTGDKELYGRLWRQPVDSNSLLALQGISRCYQGAVASDLLIAASANQHLKEPALRQLSQLSPLPASARAYLLTELANSQYRGLVTSLLLHADEPQLFSQLVGRLDKQEFGQRALLLAPDTGTPAAKPGL